MSDMVVLSGLKLYYHQELKNNKVSLKLKVKEENLSAQLFTTTI